MHLFAMFDLWTSLQSDGFDELVNELTKPFIYESVRAVFKRVDYLGISNSHLTKNLFQFLMSEKESYSREKKEKKKKILMTWLHNWFKVQQTGTHTITIKTH